MEEQKHARYVNPYTDFGFKKLFEQAEIARFTPDESRFYEESLKHYRDMRNVINSAKREGHEEGHEEGRKEGREEGREEKKREIALKLKAMNVMTAAQIAEATGLTAEEIEGL